MTTANAARFFEGLTNSILGEKGDIVGAPPSTHGVPRASAIGSGCLRQVQYITYQVPPSEPTTESGRLATNAGQVLQALSEHWILNMPGVVDVRHESPVKASNVPWTATPDMFIQWGGKLRLVEVKWMGTTRFKKLIAANDVRQSQEAIYWQMIAQLAVYPEAESALLVAFPFDYGTVRSQLVHRKEPIIPPVKYVEEIVRSESSQTVLKKIAAAVRENPVGDVLLPRGYRPPPIGEEGKDWQCNYCDYLSLCREDGD